MRKKSRRKARLGRFVLTLLVIAVGAYVGWGYISPLLASGSETVYESYTVLRGDIVTSKSFSASLDVLNSENHNNDRTVTSVRKLYVQSGQQVKEGDRLLQLDSGKVYRAGIDGMVNEMRFGEGDWVWPNVQLIQICDLENLQVSLQVDEYDVDKVAAGQKCTVTIVALGLDFETEIAYVNRLSSASGSVAYYEVTAELTVPENVLPGMTASVSIPAEESLNVLTLDMAALAFDEDKQPYVLVQTGEAYERRMLETGLSDGMKVEIISGLSEGDVVYAAREQKVEAEGFSLASLYKQVVGEKVVINDMSGGNRGSMGGGNRGGMPAMSDGEMPKGMTPEGEQETAEADGEAAEPQADSAQEDAASQLQREGSVPFGERPARSESEAAAPETPAQSTDLEQSGGGTQ